MWWLLSWSGRRSRCSNRFCLFYNRFVHLLRYTSGRYNSLFVIDDWNSQLLMVSTHSDSYYINAKFFELDCVKLSHAGQKFGVKPFQSTAKKTCKTAKVRQYYFSFHFSQLLLTVRL
jgi:hypothetical protein